MTKKILAVAIAALVLSAGVALAEPLMSVAEGAGPGMDDHRPGQLTDTDMASVTGRGACTEGIQALGKSAVFLGKITVNHWLVFAGYVTTGIGPLICR